MSPYRHCRQARQWILFCFLLFSFVTGFAANPCLKHFQDNSAVEEVKAQWNYLDLLKAENDKALKHKSNRLLRAIQKHLFANGVQFSVDPENSAALLLSVLPPEKLREAHPLNRFATTLFGMYGGLRVEINPLKLKMSQAGALFDDSTNRLTLALDNILDLKNDSFVGHELKHAYYFHQEVLKRNHAFMGWLKKKESTPDLQTTYPDAFSLDELAAYYYQVITLLHEAQRDPESLATAKDFTRIGLELLAHVNSAEIFQFVETYLSQNNTRVSFSHDDQHDIVSIETEHYILEMNFVKVAGRSDAELREMALSRMKDLKSRVKIMQTQLQELTTRFGRGDAIADMIQFLASKRDVLSVKP